MSNRQEDTLAKPLRSRRLKSSKKRSTNAVPSRRIRSDGSEEAIRAGERIALAAFGSGLKLAAAFGTVAARTAGLALASLASGADKFSELVREEARRSYDNHVNARSPRSRKHRRVPRDNGQERVSKP